MFETIFDEALMADRAGDRHKVHQLIQQMASAPDEAVAGLLRMLQEPHKGRRAMAIRVLHVIGYPHNEPAIPALILRLRDPNEPGWWEIVETLVDMGADVVVPHLMCALLEPGPPYHLDFPKNGVWDFVDNQGIFALLKNESVGSEYALRCCPAINYLLTQIPAVDNILSFVDVDLLLEVVEKAGDQVPYVLPTLITLAKKYPEGELGGQVRALIATLHPQTGDTYKLLIANR
jgi:hypothetical protein